MPQQGLVDVHPWPPTPSPFASLLLRPPKAQGRLRRLHWLAASNGLL